MKELASTDTNSYLVAIGLGLEFTSENWKVATTRTKIALFVTSILFSKELAVFTWRLKETYYSKVKYRTKQSQGSRDVPMILYPLSEGSLIKVKEF